MRKTNARSAPLCGELRLNQVGEVADGLHGLEFGGLELDAEARFDGDDQVDVVEGVPLGNIVGGEAGAEDDAVVVEQVVEDGGELLVDVLLLHSASDRPFHYRWA